MKHITKNQSQDCRIAIQNYMRDKRNRGEKAHYDSFLDKDLLRLSLLKEQGYICAYCMRRLENNPLRTKIEHWKTREDYNAESDFEGTLDYNNLLAVCDGKTFDFLHCDSKRAQENPKLTVNPIDKLLIAQITYLKNGKIESLNEAIQKDLEEHLNLNCQILQDNRKKILNDIQKAFDIRCKGKNYEQSEAIKKKIVQYFIEKKRDAYFEPYCAIVIFIYKKYL
jgi:uncharacterized protein (TIGR02646 family)